MKENIGYQRALTLAEDQLAQRDPLEVVANTGAIWTGSNYEIPWMGRNMPLEQGSTEERIIWMHYLLANGPKQLRGRHITYRQVPGAQIYNDNFIKRCVNPMLRFSEELELFMALGERLGGRPESMGDASFTLPLLPYIPLTYIIWQGDDEIPANGTILYDESAIEWMNAEDLVVMAGMPVYAMLSMAK